MTIMKCRRFLKKILKSNFILYLIIISIILAPIQAIADEYDDLDSLKSQQSELAEQYESYESKIEDLKSDKKDAVEKYQLLVEENNNIANQIDNTQKLIKEYKSELAETQEALDNAQAEYENYSTLCAERMNGMYESDSVSLLEFVFTAREFSELLTCDEDLKIIAQYDSSITAGLKQSENDLKTLSEQQESAKTEQENLLAELNTKQSELEANEKEAEATVSEIKNNISQYKETLANIVVKQDDLKNDILEKESEIAEKEAEQAREAELKVQEAEQAQEAALMAASPETTDENTVSENTVSENTASDASDTSDIEKAYESEEENSSVQTGITGQDVIDYAVQFVGNRYVWGGVSLTNGCDCSGFVMSVYAHFGYSLPHYSGSLRQCGTEVSYSDAQPGDIICYDGHVGLYMGSGQMVNAFDTAHGIIICSVNTNRLLSVRRIL